jgi:UPF0755 protein
MSLTLFFIGMICLLALFQFLQIYFFTKRYNIAAWMFVGFFWCIFTFFIFNLYSIFSTNFPVDGNYKTRTIIIKKGATLAKVADQLYSEYLIRNRNHFIWTAKLLGYQNRVKAGKFNVASYMSNYAIITQLTSNAMAQERITIVEGLPTRQVASLFASRLNIDSTRFMKIVQDKSIAQSLEIDAPSLNGYLFPETYNFMYGGTELEIIETLVREFKKNISDSLLIAAKNLNLSLHQIVTLASIIEGEAGIDEERPVISAVYHNRLKKNMKLEADPTIQYIIPDGPRRLTKSDLTIDSPFNTYLHTGLPPEPINNPGKKSIYAAVFPVKQPFLYFVATGDGRHAFSKTLQEHLLAKKKLDRLRKEVQMQTKKISVK